MCKVNIPAVVCAILAGLIVSDCGSKSGTPQIPQTKKNQHVILSDFRVSRNFREQEKTNRYSPDVRIHINAPSPENFDFHKKTGIVLYALPNGNTIEFTAGKQMEPGDDWHYDIQHIAAQTRFLRAHVHDYNLVVAYLETSQKSWPAWKREHPDYTHIIPKIVESLKSQFSEFDPFLIMSGHSGGGSFIFGYLESREEIPDDVERITFLDSTYGYEDIYGAKIADWLRASKHHYLCVIAYNDSVALYQGKPFVSATGGTWYRSKMMVAYLSNHFNLKKAENEEFIRYTGLNGRIQFILKKNPGRRILHTVQVELNGFIQGTVSGTRYEDVDYTYYGPRVYSEWIRGTMPDLKPLVIPPRQTHALTGSAFMKKVETMEFWDREKEIYTEISQGNISDFLRDMITIESTFQDSTGTPHTVKYEVMPDYLAIGSNADFCRIPVGPQTAQRIADLFGATMPTRKLVDDIYVNATVKLEPVTYYPVGNANELVPKFVAHNAAIEEQRKAANGTLGELVAGIKKDVVISNRIVEPNRLGHVVIYGWHRPDGNAIQPLTNIHYGWYTDYSHGVRLMNDEVMVDGVPMNVTDVLQDPVLYKLLSDENGVMPQPRYDVVIPE